MKGLILIGLRREVALIALAIAVLHGSLACAPADSTPRSPLEIVPAAVEVMPGNGVHFDAVLEGVATDEVTWAVEETAGGTIDAAGHYNAPAVEGEYHVLAASRADPTKRKRAKVRVTVEPAPVDPTPADPAPTAPAPTDPAPTAPAPTDPAPTDPAPTDPAPTDPAPTAPPATNPAPAGVVPAFLGAEGAGTKTAGGRGGAVIEVTNLSDSGAGSLRACVQASGPRTCVFRVSGTIALLSPLRIDNPFITIAGQTAPGGGIQINGKAYRDNVITVNTNDVVIRYLRIRQGWNNAPDYSTAGGNGGGSGISLESGGRYNVVVDHVSMAWSVFKTVSVWSSTGSHNNLTFSWNVFGEPLYPANDAVNMNISSSSTAIADGMTDIDLHHNLFTSQDHRAPLLCNRSGRFVNNVIYNWRYYAVRLKGNWDVVGNAIKAGPFTGGNAPTHEIQIFDSGEANATTAAPSVYLTGNVGPHNGFDPARDNWSTLTAMSIDESRGEGSATVPTWYRRSTPLSTPAGTAPITTHPVANLATVMLPIVGASRRLDCDGRWVMNRDATDTRIVTTYLNGTGPSTPLNTENDVGGYPVIASGTACADADHDGMPDAFETARGLNPSDASDRNGKTVQPPFTNLEAYLNGR
jgi:pectate lyase